MKHVYPVGDDRPHCTEGTTCDCDPEITFDDEGGMLVVHQSFDGRELIEQAEEIRVRTQIEMANPNIKTPPVKQSFRK